MAAEYRERTRPRETFEERVCALDECDETFTWRSTHPKQMHCSKSHYMKSRERAKRAIRVDVPEGELLCTQCGISKLRGDFPPSVQHNKRTGWCSQCAVAYGAQWARDNRAKRSAATRRSRAARLLRKYGAPSDDIDLLIADQGGVCLSCGGLPGVKGFQIDHDHDVPTEHSYRGLLCHSCNIGLGAFDDDVTKLQAAITYLQR